MRNSLYVLLLISYATVAQTLSPAQQKALNNYIDYANQSAEEVTSVTRSLRDYYPRLERAMNDKRGFAVRYTCAIQPEDFYLNKARAETKALGSYSSALETRLEALYQSAQKVDKACKALDTYHKLEDYKQDNYRGAKEQIEKFPALLDEYHQAQQALDRELQIVFRKIQPASGTAYPAADERMRSSLEKERAFIDLWKINMQEDVHTGWIADKLEASILDTDQRAKLFMQKIPAVKYPASDMVKSFGGGLNSIVDTKRSGLDGYTTEAKKSDEHSNQVYDYLINYYNGVLVSFYNMYLQYAGADGYRGLKAMKYVPMLEIRNAPVAVVVSVHTFTDIPRKSITVTPQKVVMAKTAFAALGNYIEFTNETWRQVRFMQSALRSFNSSAKYLKEIENFDKRAPLHFDYKDFEQPRSLYQKTITESKALSTLFSGSLNDQATVLMNIMKEMDELGASIQEEVTQRRYEHDHLNNLFSMMERLQKLFLIWDEKKEQLYSDARATFDSYLPDSPTNSWQKSGTALHALVDLDRAELFKARDYYRNGTPASISTALIDAGLREIISNEFENMNGIKRLGRNNGMCPYTPYEDLPKTSRALSEGLQILKPATASSNVYSHPYHTLVYHYNDIVDDYNKFCELSEVMLLKVVKQPELFSLEYPDKERKSEEPTIPERPASRVVQQPAQPETTAPTAISNPSTIRHDTIVVERRDTVYLHENSEDLRSMEGYATNNMVLLLDVSGSMNSPDKLPLLKASVLNLLSMMRMEDEVSIVVYSGKAKVLLPSTSFKEEDKIRKVIESLKSEGKTDGNAGLKLAYKVADENYIRGGNNRIILATDGEFPISNDSYKLIEQFAADDIFISVFNFGKSTVSSKSLEKVAASGRGNYEFITKENVEFKLIQEAKSKKAK